MLAAARGFSGCVQILLQAKAAISAMDGVRKQ